MNGVDGASGFDLVVPSLPTCIPGARGASEKAKPGRVADRMHMLMRELGYERYGIQGGDWRAIIAVELVRKHPESIAGLHYNFAPWANFPKPPRIRRTHDFQRNPRVHRAPLMGVVAWRLFWLTHINRQICYRTENVS